MTVVSRLSVSAIDTAWRETLALRAVSETDKGCIERGVYDRMLSFVKDIFLSAAGMASFREAGKAKKIFLDTVK